MSRVEFPWELERIRSIRSDVDSLSEVGSIRSEDHQHPKISINIVDDYLLVAVGKKFKENKSTVVWALKNSQGKKICILHIYIPCLTVPYARLASTEDLTAYRQQEKREISKSLDEYILLCGQEKVNAQKLLIEAESIEKGIVTLISENMIANLVMGGGLEQGWARIRARRNMQLTSKKAIYVHSQAPSFCRISFVCNGQLIHTREGVQAVQPLNTSHTSGGTNSLRSLSRTETELSYSRSDIYHDENTSTLNEVRGYHHDTEKYLTPSVSNVISYGFALPSTSSDAVRGELVLEAEPPIDEEYASPSSPSDPLPEGSVDDELYEKYEKLMVEVEHLRDEVHLESRKRRKAEKETFEAIRKAKATESLYYEEQDRRKELEEKLIKEMKETVGIIQKAKDTESLYYEEKKRRKELEGKMVKDLEEFEIIKDQHAKVLEELGVVLLQKSSLESEIEKSNLMVKELDRKILSALGLLEQYKNERDDLEMKLNNALLRIDPTSTQVSRFFADFTHQEILEATDNFNPSRKIGEGGFGVTYKGRLRHVQVAIKVPSSDSMQGLQEFQHEVDALSKLRHPNIVTLIGVCSEASALIYEYVPNGNLDDRLECKDNTPPLSWQTRIRIAAELCSVLMFLHSSQPESLIHGDLKPANVLLDASLSCKLSDFGICRNINNQSMDGVTRIYRTEVPKGTFAFMDPEFLSTGELTLKSDVYAFGIILLRLLTGKSALGITRVVQNALDKDNLNTILDSSGGEWPYVQANQLALLGLRCCEMQRKNRPDLEAFVWRVLESMRVSSGSPNLGRGDDDEHVPSYFMCPIFQEVMEDPHIATDGFTYEAEALKGWLDSGHDTSPMTNLKLENQTLIPNRGLRSAIQEWIQRRRLTL